MILQGTVKRYTKVGKKCPKDGVHRSKPNCAIRSPLAMKIGGQRVYAGNEAMYVRTADDVGIKVYYSLRLGVARTEEQVNCIYDWMARYAKHGICAMPRYPILVDIDIVYRKKRINRSVWGLPVQHVHYPAKAWHKYCLGYPYSWKAVDHPDHNPAGFKLFCQVAKARMGDMVNVHDKALTLGGSAFCTKRNKWMIMDVDWRRAAHELASDS